MNKRTIIVGISLVVMFQIIVLACEYLGAVYPLWCGNEIRLRTTPVDPRSLFRGNYARLRYAISTINASHLHQKKSLRNGEVVYVELRPDKDGLYQFDGVSLKKPRGGTFIRGRIQNTQGQRGKSIYNVRYGIEAYFAPKEKALAMEKELRTGGVAIVMIAGNGKATLKEIGDDTGRL